MTTAIPARPLNFHRGSLAKGLAAGELPRVERDGGNQGAGLIRGFSLISRGEALGHRFWIDQTMVGQVHNATLEAGDKGLKVRFTHPSLSADGLGTYLGRAVRRTKAEDEAYVDQAFADLHFSKTAHTAPDGDLASYVMDLAENEPDQFGASIVFLHDGKAEEEFALAHGAFWDEDPYYGPFLNFAKFQSPDPLNVNNYPHCRLADLHGADVVDEPAANPGGLFHRKASAAHEANALAAFALGLKGAERPTLTSLNMDPDRVQSFVSRFLDQNGLVLARKDDSMSTAASSTPAAPAPAAAPPAVTPLAAGTLPTTAPAAEKPADTAPVMITRDQLGAWTAEFGAENAVNWLAAGHDLGEARRLHNAALQEQLAASRNETKELQERLASARVGEKDALSADAESVDKEKPKADPDASAVDRLTAANEARLNRTAKK
ncbi:hypothetical protein [Planctomyces sp. SH-PL14]|uniref:hypothetical protein n=1 Tax=Planctomyces sp. SH-PL14 TaxID=1632864 RepID=UPI00078B627F|nr:hypothetical protein [Planctomyces sp. SH-PL14]AMV18905.1 hypothetical protein VT03_13530 [Planctomyces sp. SH-PL14]